MTSTPQTETRARVETWVGKVHWAGHDGRPACGSATRTSQTWINPTERKVTCLKCLAAHSDDHTVDPPKITHYGEHVERRAAERAARRAAREDN